MDDILEPEWIDPYFSLASILEVYYFVKEVEVVENHHYYEYCYIDRDYYDEETSTVIEHIYASIHFSRLANLQNWNYYWI